MKLLLDTHIVLWFLNDAQKLSNTALNSILDTVNEKYVSIASAWELAVKISLGKLSIEGGTEAFFKAIDENGFELLPIKKEHLKKLESMPFIHRDPFDRILIASASAEGINLVSADKSIHLYGISVIW